MKWIKSASGEKNELRRAIQEEKIQRILLVRCQKIGDMLTFLPMVLCIRKLFPSAVITLLCHRDGVVVAERIPLVKLAVIDSHRKKKLERGAPFDLMITSSQDAGWIVLKRRHKIRFAVGVLPESLKDVCLKHRWQYRYFTDTGRYSDTDHDVYRNLKILNVLGFSGCNSIRRTLWIIGPEREAVASMVPQREGPLIVVSPSGSRPSKNWLPGNFADLCDKLVSCCRANIVFAGKGELDHRQTESIMDMMKEKAVSLVNKTTFGQLAALIERADLLISVDSGPAHIASHLDRPLIVIFGPGDFEQWRPWHLDKSKGIAIRADCKCGTTLYKCREKVHCLDSILPSDVFERARRLLGNQYCR